MVAIAGIARGQSRGDVNCDGFPNADDMAALLPMLFADPASECAAADVNSDTDISAPDIIALLQSLDPPPPTPIPEGPAITFFGLAGADGTASNPLGQIDGVPVFFRNAGFGFKIVVEGRAGLNGQSPGGSTANADPHDPSRRPDLQIESSHPLGDGSAAVCSDGVPAIDPPDFGPTQTIANALNAFACNFGSATSASFACTQDQFGTTSFLGVGSKVQFCVQLGRALLFPGGETTVSVRLRDSIGTLGPEQQLKLRVGVTLTATPSRTLTLTPSASRTPTRTPTSTGGTPTPSVTGQATSTGTATTSQTPATPTASRSTAASATPTRTRTATVTATFSSSPTRTPTVKATATSSRTRTPTALGPRGPVVTFFGITRADDTQVAPSDTTPEGLPIYTRLGGGMFNIVIEGKPGASGLQVGTFQSGTTVASTYQPDLTDFPDLQVEVSQQLGNGSMDVCDNAGSMAGGVPPTDPPNFDLTPTNINAVNDLGCRFVDGNNMAKGRSSGDSCVKRLPSEDYLFVCDGLNTSCPSGKVVSKVQFCAFIGRVIEFQPGDTTVTARLRDTGGNTGPPAQIVIRIGP
jgi:hypothetical protein